MRQVTIIFMVFAVCLLGMAEPALAKSNAKPSWVDTIAPIATITPRQQYHSKIFHATITSNKQGTIWYKVVRPGAHLVMQEKMDAYRDPVTISDEGKTTVYFFAEDLLGNKSKSDSIEYIVDTRAPKVTVTPEPGHFNSAITIRFRADEPCTYFLHEAPLDTIGRACPESLFVGDSLFDFVTAVDKVGNRSPAVKLSYVVDSSVISVTIEPREGLYNTRQSFRLTPSKNADAYYSFDPSAPAQSFTRFKQAVDLPVGNTFVRYYAQNKYGWRCSESQARFVIDTALPKIHVTVKKGELYDTLICFSKKNAVIRFSMSNAPPTDVSPRYEKPIIVPHKGTRVFKAIAKDAAGNVSEIFEWENRYEVGPVTLRFSRPGGIYNTPIDLLIQSDKPAKIVYTTDGADPTVTSTLYKDRIVLSREGVTTVRAMAIDESGLGGPIVSDDFTIDSRPPEIRVRIEENAKINAFEISLTANKPAAIYYEMGERQPTTSSPEFTAPISLKDGQTLRYFAIDKTGNRSAIKVMDDLLRPQAIASPRSGMYNKRIKVNLHVNGSATAFYRVLPDTVFKPFIDSIALNKEGGYSVEYYSEGQAGLRSAVRRNDYTIDLSPPHVSINVKKGANDSVIVFFECSKNATIYYTTDGTSPFYSQTTRTRGNKFLTSKDRLALTRKPGSDIKLAFYAEDVAGNQSTMTVLDVFKPIAVPSIPAGKDIVYDRILSVTLNTYDDRSQIYFARHGHVPTLDSATFSAPITLQSSDTLTAFVVDAAGYRGEMDTFVYKIDLPPSPDFVCSPDSVVVGTPVTFDASGTLDHETRFEKLLFRWNFSGTDPVSEFKNEPRISHAYKTPGLYHPVLEVKDEHGNIAKTAKDLLIRSLCPRGMMSIALPDGKTYCIDQYEWPNVAGVRPAASVSWVQAKMYCREAGKRLCTPDEWVGACKGVRQTEFPYGPAYRKNACATETPGSVLSGSYPNCTNSFGVYDMAGNVWEWVEGKKGDYPLMYGGSFTYGEKADCALSSQGSVGSKSPEVGFRCCK